MNQQDLIKILNHHFGKRFKVTTSTIRTMEANHHILRPYRDANGRNPDYTQGDLDMAIRLIERKIELGGAGVEWDTVRMASRR